MALQSTPGHGFPAGHAIQLVELCRRWDIEPEQLLAPLGLDRDELAAPGARLEPETLVALIQRARSLTGEPGLGVYLGLHKRLAMYGFLGLATMTSGTLGEALEGVVKLSHSISTAVTLRLRVEGSVAALLVEEHVDMGAARDVATFSFFVGMMRIAEDLIGDTRGLTLELAIERPDYFARFEHILPNTRFGQPMHRLLTPAVALTLRLPSPDPGTMELARRQCEQSLIALGFDRSVEAQVRQHLFGPRGVRNLDRWPRSCTCHPAR